MKTSSSLRTIVAASALLLSIGGVSRLAAQSAATSSVPSVAYAEGPITRTYTGTVTQTTAAGVTTSGTFNLSYRKGGFVQASTTINGAVLSYSGRLVPSPEFLQLVDFGQPLKKLRTTGLLTSPDISFVDPDGVTGAVVITSSQLPVFVNKSVAYGGLQNEDGSALTFRATRDAK